LEVKRRFNLGCAEPHSIWSSDQLILGVICTVNDGDNGTGEGVQRLFYAENINVLRLAVAAIASSTGSGL